MHKRLRLTALLVALSTILLIGWIAYLIIDLPASYRAEHWDVAWVGFDIGMVICLATTSWAMWKRRQVAIPGSMISATFLVIDSWFDVVTSQGGEDLKFAIASALIIELPSAFVLLRFSRQAIKRSIQSAHSHAGIEPTTLSLFKTNLTIFDD